MNEITTEERLRIVEELNRTANDSLGGESLQRALARITGAEDTSWRGVMRRVAELAYRPTCKIILERELRTAYGKPITGINGYILSCGHQAVGFRKPRYCPECGEEVGE